MYSCEIVMGEIQLRGITQFEALTYVCMYFYCCFHRNITVNTFMLLSPIVTNSRIGAVNRKFSKGILLLSQTMR